MELQKAVKIANQTVEELRPYCDKIEIAGSVRRKVEFPNDIEIVCIPTPCKLYELKDFVDRWRRIKGQVGGRYTQRMLCEGIKLDLFFTCEDNFGLIFLIRTGSASYSKDMMGSTVRQKGYRVKDGFLWLDGRMVSVPTEQDFYKIMKLPFVEPEFRT